MRTKLLCFIGALIISAFSMSGCGGGGGGEEGGGGPVKPICGWGDIYFTEPSLGTTQVGDSWQTQNTSISLYGYLTTPAEFSKSNCPRDTGYSITWLNETNHAAGTGSANSILVGVPFLGVMCKSRYGIEGIPLAMGANHIVVTAVRNGTTVGQDCADVQRLADTAPPTVKWTSPAYGAACVPLDGITEAGNDQ